MQDPEDRSKSRTITVLADGGGFSSKGRGRFRATYTATVAGTYTMKVQYGANKNAMEVPPSRLQLAPVPSS